MNEPILQFPDFTKEFIITTDASAIAIGAVLSQGIVGQDKPICYASRTLSSTEQKYSTIDRELLGIIWALKYFRPYVYGRHFKIYTDHRPLVWLCKMKDQNSKYARWKIKLEEYDFEIVYKKGKYNSNADALSRIKLEHHVNAIDDDNLSMIPTPDTDDLLGELLRDLGITQEEEGLPNTTFSREEPPVARKNLPMLRQDLQEQNPNQPMALPRENESTNTANSNQELEPARAIEILEEPVDSKRRQYIIKATTANVQVETDEKYGNRIVTAKIPTNNNEKQILEFMKEYMTSDGNHYIYFQNEQLYENFSRVYIKSFNNNGPKLIRCTKRIQVDKKEDQLELIGIHHEGKTKHRGIEETMNYLKRQYWWKNMKDIITKYIKSCEVCNKTKYDRHPTRPPLQLTETPDKPFKKIFIDTFTIGGEKFLTIVDTFSRVGQAIPLTATNAVDIVDALLEYFQFYGTPEEIYCDSGK